MADRLDGAEISLPPSQLELEKVKEIMKKMINVPVPNLVRHVYKVRRGKLTRIRVWQLADLGTCRTKDLFVTTNDYVLIPVNATKVENIDKVIEENSISSESLVITEEEHQEAVRAMFDW